MSGQQEVIDVDITFLGAAQTVTGSCYLVESQDRTFLVDCGLFQGSAREEALNRQAFPFNPAKLDFVLLTHAHIDHSGRLPKLVRDGFRGPVYTTRATADLCQIMLPDAGHIQEKEQEWLNRKAVRAGRPTDLPLYTAQDALDSCKLLQGQAYEASFSPVPGIRVRFRDAGHILGSAVIELWIREGEQISKVVFSGDLGNQDMPILRDPTLLDGADYLVLEATYGNRRHARMTDEVDRFVAAVMETVERGGTVIIPSFAVGRTQEVVYQLFHQEQTDPTIRAALLQVPVYIDSPMASSVTEVFRKHIDCYDEEASAYIADGKNPLDFPHLHLTRSVEASKRLNTDPGSKIILSASGMCEAGRIKHHLKHHLWRPESTILFVGYQAPGTLGRQLVDGAQSVQVLGETIRVRARLVSVEGFSGHADQDGLVNWVAAMAKKPAQVLLVHGEPPAIQALSAVLSDQLGLQTHAPQLYERLTLGTQAPQAADPKRFFDPRKNTALYALDLLQADLIAALEDLKAELLKTRSPAELEDLLDALPQRLTQATQRLHEPDPPWKGA